ncbi:MAG: cell division protein FtsL [Gammaproteobacteria bacterium RIFCSPHIGHO2_12_FULL_42_13]|nr:MAG: cell division protein FtsL [Gammaproteobacteria bacterium RIFCSPHIGHO2_12_FULL_42_13]
MTRAIRGLEWALRRREAARTTVPFRQQLYIGAFIILLLISAFSVIYLKDLSRRLFIQYQQLQQTQQQLETDWSKLLLEEGAWSTQQRVQTIATSKLNMAVPERKQVIIDVRDS